MDSAFARALSILLIHEYLFTEAPILCILIHWKSTMSFFTRRATKPEGVIAKEHGQTISLIGLDARAFVRDINKYWKTERITNNMFSHISNKEIRFEKFFAADILYILDAVMNYRSRYLSVKQAAAIRAALLAGTWLGDAVKPVAPGQVGRLNFEALKLFNFTPDKEQMDYFESYNHRLDSWQLKGDLLHAKPGVGKTFMLTALGEMVGADRIIIFCENRAVKLVWEDSMPEMYKKPPTVWSSHSNKPYNDEKIVIVHYQSLGDFYEMVMNGRFNGLKVFTGLDESHNMNDQKSMQTQLYINSVNTLGGEDNVLASGTPVKALGSELITLMRVISPVMFTPVVQERFKLIFGKSSTKGLDIIQARMGFMSYFIDKKESNTGLKEPIMKPYPIQIPNGNDFTLHTIKDIMEQFIRERVSYYRKRRPEDEKFWEKCLNIYRSKLRTPEQQKAFAHYLRLVQIVQKNPNPMFVADEIMATNQFEKLQIEPTLPKDMIKDFRDVKSIIKYTILKIQGECLGRILGGKRIECHVAMVPYIDWVGIVESTHKKTIMFTSFVEAVEAADVYTRKLDLNPICVYGKTNNDLPKIIERFDKDPKINPLLATYASLATAVRLVMADTMLVLNNPFRGYILEQAIARIYRKGQDSQPVVYVATLDTGDIPNISTRSADILKWSQDMVAAITGVRSPFEIKEAFESINEDNPNIYDENVLMQNCLNAAFEMYGFQVDPKEFELPKQIKQVPGWMR
jgi:hypothetical protein